MSPRTLLRPAVFVPGSLLVASSVDEMATPVVRRDAGMLVASLGRVGYFCVALLAVPAGPSAERIRRSRRHQQLLGELRRRAGRLLDGCELGHAADQAPTGKQWARRVLDAAARHRLDLGRSYYLCGSEADVAAARIAGATSLFVGRPDSRVQPSYAIDSLASARRIIELDRDRAADVGGRWNG